MKTNIYLFVFLVLLCFSNTSFAHFTTKGPYGGSITSLYVADTIIYVGTFEGGVYRSTNAAATSWRYINYTGLTDPLIRAFTSIGRYVLTGTGIGGVFRSSDAGNSWTPVNNGLNPSIKSLVTIGNRVLAGTYGSGVYSSRDSGSTWEQSNTGLGSGIINCFAVDGGNVYVATNSDVYLSTDSGATWTSITAGHPISMVFALTVSGGKLFAASGNSVYVTSTSSINWQQTTLGTFSTIIYHLNASEGVVYASTAKGIFTSPDDSVSWTADTAGYGGVVNASVVYDGKLFAGTQDDGIYRSTSLSSINWSEFNSGLNNLKTFAIYNSGLLVVAATNKGLFVSRDLAANYTRANTGLTDSLNITSIWFDNSKLYVSSVNGGVFISVDSGTTWNAMNNGLPTNNVSKVITLGTRIFAAAASGNVYSSDLNTVNWVTNTGLPAGLYPTSMATDGSTRVFLSTNNGVYVCTDGTSWTTNNTGLPNMYVNALAVSDTILFAAVAGSVYKIPVSGGTWSAAGTGLPSQGILSLCAASGWVAAGYKGGVHLMHANGNTWEAPDVLMYIPAYANVTMISFTSASTRIFIGTPDNSLYSNSIEEFPTGVNDIVNTIGNIGVSPNPGTGLFHVDFTNVKAQVKSIYVYDQLGRLVEQKPVNKYDQSMDLLLNCKAGIYFMVAHTDKGTVSEKIILQ